MRRQLEDPLACERAAPRAQASAAVAPRAARTWQRALLAFGAAASALLAALLLLAALASPARAQVVPGAPGSALELEGRLTALAARLTEQTLLVKATDPVGDRSGYGSAVVIDPKGLALTCAHVVEGTFEIEVTLADGRAFPARVVGTNALQDYALIQVEGAPPLSACELGDSSKVALGDWVVATGHPGGPYPDLKPSFAIGRVTGLHRKLPIAAFARFYDDAIRTDIPIFPGNSGGPLVDLDGRLIGINGAILLLNEHSYAVPVDEIRAHLPRLERGEQIAGRKGQGLPIPLGEFGERDLVRFMARFVRRAFAKDGLGQLFAGPGGEHNEATRMIERFGHALGDERFLSDFAKQLAGEDGAGADLDAAKRLLDAFADPRARSLEELLGPLGDLFGGGPPAPPPGSGRRLVEGEPDHRGPAPSQSEDPLEQLLRGLLDGGQNPGNGLLRDLLDALSGEPPPPSADDLSRAAETLSSRELRDLVESTDAPTLRRLADELGPERLEALVQKLHPGDLQALLEGPRGPELREMLGKLYAQRQAQGGGLPGLPFPRARSAPATPPAQAAPPAARAPAVAPPPVGGPPTAGPPAEGSPGKPTLGIKVDLGAEAVERIRGVLVAEVVPGGPAARAGLRRGDVLVELGGHAIEGPAGLGAALEGLRPGQSAPAVVLRTSADGLPLGQRVELRIVVGAR